VRDVFQVVSVLFGLLTIWSVMQRTRRYGERLRDWLPIIVISVLIVAFYIGVFIDQRVDFMSSSDVSSAIRITSEALILIFVRYFPVRLRI
jgi:glucan phosphoethanolaminetransferase (alkaline phosphatase superfamily)